MKFTVFAQAIVFACAMAACGGSSKKKTTTADGSEMDKGPAALHIPVVNPELCSANGKRVQSFDLDRDGRPDVWKLYKSDDQGGTTVEIMTCKQVDYDHDGRKDYVAIYHDTGELIAEEFDFTFEGVIDARKHYAKASGRVFLVERDSDHDKKPDVWESYGGDGDIESVRRDRNADGKPDLWEEYENGRLVAILYDDDYDNRVDRREVRAGGGPGDSENGERRPNIADEFKKGGDQALDEARNAPPE